MAYPYIPPPSAHEFAWQFALFLSKFGYDVEITISKEHEGRSTVSRKAFQRDLLTKIAADLAA